MIDLSEVELDIAGPCLCGNRAGTPNHFGRHINADELASGTGAPGGQPHIQPTTTAEVRDDFPRSQSRERSGIAAGEPILACGGNPASSAGV